MLLYKLLTTHVKCTDAPHTPPLPASPLVLKQVACGGSHSLFVTNSGKVYACGRGEFGRLGSGTEADYSAPLLVEPCAGKQVDSVACGGQHTFCVYSEP